MFLLVSTSDGVTVCVTVIGFVITYSSIVRMAGNTTLCAHSRFSRKMARPASRQHFSTFVQCFAVLCGIVFIDIVAKRESRSEYKRWMYCRAETAEGFLIGSAETGFHLEV